jgi:K+-sensing histidine kinase KdpD
MQTTNPQKFSARSDFAPSHSSTPVGAGTLGTFNEFVAIFAHQVRNPLGVISGFASLLERELEPDDPRGRMAKKILAAVKSADGIIKDWLFYTQALHPVFQPVEVVQELEETVKALSSCDNLKQNSHMETEILSRPIWAPLDIDLFRMMTIYILKSATSTPGVTAHLRVDRFQSPNRFIMMVALEGLFIREDEREKLFSFGNTLPINEHALQLAIVKKIVEAHGGKMAVQYLEEKRMSYHLEFTSLEEGSFCHGSNTQDSCRRRHANDPEPFH